jgi:LmbE family N-acetylglucosaminyl deacetylase
MSAHSGDAPALVLSPHLDDAALGCWSVLDDPECPAQVVNVFAGVPPVGTRGGWDAQCGVPDSTEMVHRRRAEDERALAVAGVAPIHLEFLDGQYLDEARDIETIAAAVKLAVPRWSALYAPAGSGGFVHIIGTAGLTLAPHPDHEAVRAVALELERADAPTFFYAELPYSIADGRPERWAEAIDDFTPALERAVSRPLRLTPNELSDEALERRIEALAHYETQLPRVEEGVGSFVREPAVLRREAYWRSRGGDTRRGNPRRRRQR